MRVLLACPRCLRSDTLYENVAVSGWRGLRPIPLVDLHAGKAAVDVEERRWDRNRRFADHRHGEVDWDSVDFESYGCSCDPEYEMQRGDLVTVTDEGELWTPPHPGQSTLA